jgi:hypothetical protein
MRVVPLLEVARFATPQVAAASAVELEDALNHESEP